VIPFSENYSLFRSKTIKAENPRIKKQGWARRERRKRDKPNPASMLLLLYTKMLGNVL
jgi:hypothetical protein